MSGRNGIKELRLVRIEHSAKRDMRKRHEEKTKGGDRNITPKIALRHRRNLLLSIDIMPGIRIINIVIVGAGGGRTSIARTDRWSMNAGSGSTSMTGSTGGLSRRGGREAICKWRRHRTD